MKRILVVLAISLVTLGITSCASGAYSQGGHKVCGAYGNPWFKM